MTSHLGIKHQVEKLSPEYLIPASWQSNVSFGASDCPSTNVCGA